MSRFIDKSLGCFNSSLGSVYFSLIIYNILFFLLYNFTEFIIRVLEYPDASGHISTCKARGGCPGSLEDDWSVYCVFDECWEFFKSRNSPKCLTSGLPWISIVDAV